jgi:putative hemolysin
MSIGSEIFLIFALVLLNGVLAMSEIALVSARKVRLRQRAEAGDAGARAALELAESPGRLLSTVQIGITLVGILAGAFGGATLSQQLAGFYGRAPWLAPYAEGLGLGTVVLGITYLSLVLGELVPKQLGLNAPERIAAFLARPLKFLSRIAAPVVFVLDGSSRILLRLLGTRPSTEPPITDEELKHLLVQGTESGVFAEGEQAIMTRVLHLDERRVGELATRRSEMLALDLDAPLATTLARISGEWHSYYPVYSGVSDRIVGVVAAHDLWQKLVAGEAIELRALLREPLYLPEGLSALQALERLRNSEPPLALVLDEHGGIEGLITLHDLLRAIVGELSRLEPELPSAHQREDGSWLLGGTLPVAELIERLALSEAEAAELEDLQTLGGFVMHVIGSVPAVGDHFEWHGLRFEVVDMDGRRVDQVLVARLPTGQRLGDLLAID